MDYFRKRVLAKACASYRSTSEFVCWKDARTILLIFDSDEAEQNSEMRIAIDKIEAEGKRVTECMFVDKKKAVTSSIDDRIVVDRNGIDWLGRPSSVAATQLMENGQFDIVVSLSEKETMTYVAMAVEAKMKCGRQNSNHVLDFQIEGDMGQEQVLEEIVRYLNMIKN